MESNIDNAVTGAHQRGISDEPMYSGITSFYRRKYSKDLAGVDVAVSGVPLDLTVTNRSGTRFGPRAIREASTMMAWDKPWPWPDNPFEVLNVIDYGDCYFDSGKPDVITETITDHARKILAAGASMLTFGGDHYISYPIIKAHAEINGPVSLVHFDAHSDTWSEDEKRLDHGTMFYHGVKENLISAEHSLQIGLRTHNKSTHGFNVIDVRMAQRMGPAAIADAIKKVTANRAVYLTFDIDCLDPAYAPGTGTPVAGGFSSYFALEIIRSLNGLNLKGVDVVEVSPPYDVSNITALAAATIAAELLCVMAGNKKP